MSTEPTFEPNESQSPPASIDDQIDKLDPGIVKRPAPVLVGESGAIYRAVDLLSEMTTRHKNYIRDVLRPMFPTLAAIVSRLGAELDAGGADAIDRLTNDDVFQLLKSVKVSDLFVALIEDDADLELVAALYLPNDPDDRYFHLTTSESSIATSDGRLIDDNVAARMADLSGLSYLDKLDAFKRFFMWSLSSSPTSFRGFMAGVMTGKGTTTTTTR